MLIRKKRFTGLINNGQNLANGFKGLLFTSLL